jgi:hypothetical protein
MGNKQPTPISIPSAWQLDQKVRVVFPGNATLDNCKVIKVAFTNYGKVLYDIEVPFEYAGTEAEEKDGITGHFRIHGLDNWFLTNTQEDWDTMQQRDKEEYLVGELNKMCEESLPPELFEKWVEVHGMLHSTRRGLKSIIPNTKKEDDPELTYAAALEMVAHVCSEKLPPDLYKKWHTEMFKPEAIRNEEQD